MRDPHPQLARSEPDYPPSQVPREATSYSQQRAVQDVIAVLDHAGVDKAHMVGHSMGGFAALHCGLDYPERARSLCVASAGYGAEPAKQEVFKRETQNTAAMLLEQDLIEQHKCHGPIPI